MKDRFPSMPFFVSDYLGSSKVRLMSLEERGAYCHLLFMQWQEGALEYNPKNLAKLLDCSVEDFERVWSNISSRFVMNDDGTFYNAKVENTRKAYLSTTKKLSKAGRKGGKATQARLKRGLKPG